MRRLFTNTKLDIASGQAVSGIADGPHALHVHRGRVWLTVEGIAYDYFLQAGDSFTTLPGRLTVIEADQDALVETRRAPASPVLAGLRSAAATLLRRLAPKKTAPAALQRGRICNDACC